MALHEKLRRILPRMPSLPLEPELSALPVARLREQINLCSSAPPPEVFRVEEGTMGLSGRTLRYRLYRPSDAATLPGLVYFHGGGFVAGTLDTHDRLCRTLALDSGCAVVAVEYRLAPEHAYPAAVDDAYDSCVWTLAHAERLGLDPDSMAVGGDSAGGTLAAVVCLMSRSRGGPALRHQLLIYPVADAACDTPSYRLHGRGFTLTSDLMRFMWRTYLAGADGGAFTASPLRAPSFSGLPSATVITAEYDVLCDEGLDLVRALSSADVEVTHLHADDLVHGFATMTAALGPARDAIAWAGAAVARALRT